MNRTITILCLFLLVLLSGCSSGHWYKADMSNFNQDGYQCGYDATIAAPFNYLHPFRTDRWYGSCMRSKGYEWVKD